MIDAEDLAEAIWSAALPKGPHGCAGDREERRLRAELQSLAEALPEDVTIGELRELLQD